MCTVKQTGSYVRKKIQEERTLNVHKPRLTILYTKIHSIWERFANHLRTAYTIYTYTNGETPTQVNPTLQYYILFACINNFPDTFLSLFYADFICKLLFLISVRLKATYW